MTFGDRLRVLRVTNKMTQEDLAKQVSREKMSISKYESGKMMPSSSTLVALCNIFGVGLDYFFNESNVHIAAVPVFRTHTNISESDRIRLIQQTEQAVGNLMEISEICGYKRDFSSLKALRRHADRRIAIEKRAEDIRQEWSLGNDPIENLMEVAETHGFTIILVDDPKSFDAALYNDDTYGPIIVLKRNVPKYRQRVILAHELGHYFILGESSSQDFYDAEMKADRFAAAFLVPQKSLIEDMGNIRTVISSEELCMMRKKYGVSISFLLARMNSLEIISDTLKDRWDRYDHAGMIETRCSMPKEDFQEIEEPRLVRKLVYRAVAEGYITERKGIDLLTGGYFGTSALTSKKEGDA